MTREPIERKALEYISNHFGKNTIQLWRTQARQKYVHDPRGTSNLETFENSYILQQYNRLHRSKEKQKYD